MVKFVWLDVPGPGRVPVNPDQVAYLRQIDGQTRVVFGAIPGGFHELTVLGNGDEIAKRLEAGVSAPGRPPSPGPGFHARQDKRRTSKAP
jgi:hypothetical protein